MLTQFYFLEIEESEEIEILPNVRISTLLRGFVIIVE